MVPNPPVGTTEEEERQTGGGKLGAMEFKRPISPDVQVARPRNKN